MRTHKFYANSQLIIATYVCGEPYRIRFRPLGNGVSLYTTSDPAMVWRIKQSSQYKRGLITEEVIEEKEEVKKEVVAPKPVVEEKKTPSWMKPMRTEEPTFQEPAEKEQTPLEEEERKEKSQVDLFGMKEEDLAEIDNLTDAKTYLKDVLGAKTTDINTIAKFKSYCKENGVLFPNLEMD